MKEELKNYGVFTYQRNNQDGGAIESIHLHSKKAALGLAKRKIKDLDKDTLWLEVWEKGEDGLWGNTGEPILTTY